MKTNEELKKELEELKRINKSNIEKERLYKQIKELKEKNRKKPIYEKIFKFIWNKI